TSRRADIPKADTPPRKRLLLTAPRPRCEVGESSAAAAARQPRPTMARRVDCSFVDTVETRVRARCLQKDRAAVRAEIEVLRRERLAYEQESIQTRQDLARSEAHCRALETRVTVLETEDAGSSSETLVMIVNATQSVKFNGLLPASRRYRSLLPASSPV
ncbi:hypothetical protein Tco_0950760, partial [Tanacetum coccineum]